MAETHLNQNNHFFSFFTQLTCKEGDQYMHKKVKIGEPPLKLWWCCINRRMNSHFNNNNIQAELCFRHCPHLIIMHLQKKVCIRFAVFRFVRSFFIRFYTFFTFAKQNGGKAKPNRSKKQQQHQKIEVVWQVIIVLHYIGSGAWLSVYIYFVVNWGVNFFCVRLPWIRQPEAYTNMTEYWSI